MSLDAGHESIIQDDNGSQSTKDEEEEDDDDEVTDDKLDGAVADLDKVKAFNVSTFSSSMQKRLDIQILFLFLRCLFDFLWMKILTGIFLFQSSLKKR